MKAKLKSLMTTAILVFAATGIFSSCKKDVKATKASGEATSPRAAVAIPGSAFSLWQSCSTYPTRSGNYIEVPFGGTECSTNYVGAQQNGGQTASGMSFYGSFIGVSGAPDGAQEMAVFICDNVSTWTGREMGFVKTLNDNVLKAYVQSPGKYIYATISTGNTGNHTYKCQVNPNNNSMVDFYVDNVYKLTLNNPGVSYKNMWSYFVGTTHRTVGGWSAGNSKITMSSMNVY